MTGSRPAETAPPRLRLSSASPNPAAPPQRSRPPVAMWRSRSGELGSGDGAGAPPDGRNSGGPASGTRDVPHRSENGIHVYGFWAPGENERGVREGPRYTPTGTTLRNSVTLWRILSGRAAAKGWCYRLHDVKGIRYPGTSRSLRAQSGTGTSAVTRRLCISLDGTLTAADFAERVRLGPWTPRSGSAESRGAAQTLGHGPSPTSLSRPFSRPLGP